jgi:hypothetical protein
MNNFSTHPFYRRHDLDSAMNSLFGFYKKHFLVLFLTSFVMAVAVQIVSVRINLGDMTATTDPMVLLEKYKTLIIPYLEIMAISLIFNVFIQYYIIYSPMEGNPTILESIVKSLKYLPAYLIICILFVFMASIAMIFGLLLFIVGIFFAILWVGTLFLFVLPVLMAEGTDIGKALGRTFKLAHSNFWSNLGWVAIMGILLIVAGFVLGAIAMIPFSGNFLKMILHPEEAKQAMDFMNNPWYIGFSSLLSAVTGPIIPLLSAVLYFNGRAREEVPVQLNEIVEPQKVRVEDLYAKPYSEDHPDNPDKKQE